jgi:hypothetical protein
MKKFSKFLCFAGLIFIWGCSLSPDEKGSREQALQQAAQNFVGVVVQGNWAEAYRQTDGTLGSSDQLKSQLSQSWVQDGTLIAGDIVSLAWIDDKNAKVKLTWSFQSGSVQSFSSESFVWTWKGNAWKYRGRVLR